MTALICPRCEQPLGVSCECRSWSRRKFFAGFGLALAGTAVAPNYVLAELAPRTTVGPQGNILHVWSGTNDIAFTSQADIAQILANVYKNYRVNAFPVLSPLLANIGKRMKPKSLFDPPDPERWGRAVYWDVVVTQPPTRHVPMHSIVHNYQRPRGSFAVFERFVEQHYAVS